MKLKLLVGRLNHALHQRNALFLLTVALLLLNGLQAVGNLLNSRRVIVMPPEISREFWVEKNRVSASYLEEMALFFSAFILEMSRESATYKRDVILRNTVSEGYGTLKAKLLEDERRLKKEHVVTSFQPNTVKVNDQRLTAEVTGDLARFVGEKRIAQSRDTYFFTFVYRQGRLLIKSFEFLRSSSDV